MTVMYVLGLAGFFGIWFGCGYLFAGLYLLAGGVRNSAVHTFFSLTGLLLGFYLGHGPYMNFVARVFDRVREQYFDKD